MGGGGESKDIEISRLSEHENESVYIRIVFM